MLGIYEESDRDVLNAPLFWKHKLLLPQKVVINQLEPGILKPLKWDLRAILGWSLYIDQTSEMTIGETRWCLPHLPCLRMIPQLKTIIYGLILSTDITMAYYRWSMMIMIAWLSLESYYPWSYQSIINHIMHHGCPVAHVYPFIKTYILFWRSSSTPNGLPRPALKPSSPKS